MPLILHDQCARHGYFMVGKHHRLVELAVVVKPFSFNVPSNLVLFSSRESSSRESIFGNQMKFHKCSDYKEMFISFSDEEREAIKLYKDMGAHNYPKPWANTFRLRHHLDYLKSKECSGKDYILFVDSLFYFSGLFVLTEVS